MQRYLAGSTQLDLDIIHRLLIETTNYVHYLRGYIVETPGIRKLSLLGR